MVTQASPDLRAGRDVDVLGRDVIGRDLQRLTPAEAEAFRRVAVVELA